MADGMSQCASLFTQTCGLRRRAKPCLTSFPTENSQSFRKNSCYFPQSPSKITIDNRLLLNKYKFGAKNFLPTIDGAQSEVSDTSARFWKMPSETSDTSTHIGKVSSEASDASAQFEIMQSEASDASARLGIMPSEASDTSAQFGKRPSETSDGFARFGIMPSEPSDTSAQFRNTLFEVSDFFAQHCEGKIHRIKTSVAHVAV